MKRTILMTVVAVGMAMVGNGASAQGHCHHVHGCGGGFNGGYWPMPSYPQYPIYQDSGNFDGFNANGGIDTSGVTVFNTVNDPYRDMSRFNGSARQVNRPVFDMNGRIIGYKTGVQWTNSVTGQSHFEGQTITDNGLGGVNVQQQFRSVRGSGR
ncbi:MAG: hypothetical protein ACKOSQ_03455 [Planctomycetaceae bacterium]